MMRNELLPWFDKSSHQARYFCKVILQLYQGRFIGLLFKCLINNFSFSGALLEFKWEFLQLCCYSRTSTLKSKGGENHIEIKYFGHQLTSFHCAERPSHPFFVKKSSLQMSRFGKESFKKLLV